MVRRGSTVRVCQRASLVPFPQRPRRLGDLDDALDQRLRALQTAPNGNALALDRRDLATSLTQGVPPLAPLHQHALTSSQAQLAEATGNPSEAATLYADAAQRWHEFGNVPERACALLGQGRSLHALGDPGAEQPLLKARELFASMGYKPALAEADALLRQAQAAAS
jgi:hypothetical protein